MPRPDATSDNTHASKDTYDSFFQEVDGLDRKACSRRVHKLSQAIFKHWVATEFRP